jgi:undecaprenyl pyrophosphate phosphatase UppP
MLALGTAVAAATGLLALAWLRRLALRDHFHRFAWYLVPLGAAAFLLR